MWHKTSDAASYQFYDTQNNFCIFKSKSFCLNRLQNVFNQSSLWNLSLTNWIWLLVVYLRVNDRRTRVTEFCWKWNAPAREANTSSASTEEKLVRLQRSSSCFGPERVGSGWTSQWASVQTLQYQVCQWYLHWYWSTACEYHDDRCWQLNMQLVAFKYLYEDLMSHWGATFRILYQRQYKGPKTHRLYYYLCFSL